MEKTQWKRKSQKKPNIINAFPIPFPNLITEKNNRNRCKYNYACHEIDFNRELSTMSNQYNELFVGLFVGFYPFYYR